MFCLKKTVISRFYLVLFVCCVLFHAEERDFIKSGSELRKNKVIYVKREFRHINPSNKDFFQHCALKKKFKTVLDFKKFIIYLGS